MKLKNNKNNYVLSEEIKCDINNNYHRFTKDNQLSDYNWYNYYLGYKSKILKSTGLNRDIMHPVTLEEYQYIYNELLEDIVDYQLFCDLRGNDLKISTSNELKNLNIDEFYFEIRNLTEDDIIWAEENYVFDEWDALDSDMYFLIILHYPKGKIYFFNEKIIIYESIMINITRDKSNNTLSNHNAMFIVGDMFCEAIINSKEKIRTTNRKIFT